MMSKHKRMLLSIMWISIASIFVILLTWSIGQLNEDRVATIIASIIIALLYYVNKIYWRSNYTKN